MITSTIVVSTWVISYRFVIKTQMNNSKKSLPVEDRQCTVQYFVTSYEQNFKYILGILISHIPI